MKRTMNTTNTKYTKSPIVETIFSIDCDMKKDFDLIKIEDKAKNTFINSYPIFQKKYAQEHKIEINTSKENISQPTIRNFIQGFQFLKEDKKQLIQLLSQGFSFNKLAPYTTLDDYISIIQEAWMQFVNVVEPIKIRTIHLRYVNKIMLPFENEKVDLDEYFNYGPKLHDENNFGLITFFSKYNMIEKSSNNQANIIFANQNPTDDKHLPVILDIDTISYSSPESNDWENIMIKLTELRTLAYNIFDKQITKECKCLFQ